MQPKEKPNAKKIGWVINETRIPYESERFYIREDDLEFPDGKSATFVDLVNTGYVSIIPITKEGKIILIYQYRFSCDKWFWEIPAGTIADKQGMSLEEAALEELREEIGGKTEKLEKLNFINISKGDSEKIAHMFIAHDVVCDSDTEHEAGEHIEKIKEFSIEEVLEMVDQGEIGDIDTAYAVLHYARKKHDRSI